MICPVGFQGAEVRVGETTLGWVWGLTFLGSYDPGMMQAWPMRFLPFEEQVASWIGRHIGLRASDLRVTSWRFDGSEGCAWCDIREGMDGPWIGCVKATVLGHVEGSHPMPKIELPMPSEDESDGLFPYAVAAWLAIALAGLLWMLAR